MNCFVLTIIGASVTLTRSETWGPAELPFKAAVGTLHIGDLICLWVKVEPLHAIAPACAKQLVLLVKFRPCIVIK